MSQLTEIAKPKLAEIDARLALLEAERDELLQVKNALVVVINHEEGAKSPATVNISTLQPKYHTSNPTGRNKKRYKIVPEYHKDLKWTEKVMYGLDKQEDKKATASELYNILSTYEILTIDRKATIAKALQQLADKGVLDVDRSDSPMVFSIKKPSEETAQ